jgi:protease I
MPKRVLILATDGFEQSELIEPRKALEAAGFETVVASPKTGSIKGWNHSDWGESVPVDAALEDVDADDFDALLLPGGQMNPDKLRMEERAVDLVEAFDEAGKPIAAICHGPWTLVEADVLRDKTLTSWPSLKTDISNAGGQWLDAEVFVCPAGDWTLVTSRKPDDLDAFCVAAVTAFAATDMALPAD